MWDSGWDDIFRKNEWGRYPPEEVVRVVARNFFGAPRRSDVAILEIGCGTGANLWFVAREGFRASGIDGSQVAIDRARQRMAEEHLTADLRVGDVATLPYANAAFDAVLDVECLYANSLKDSRGIVREVHRVLKPGGLFFSKTFMTGTYGDGKGTRLEGEPNTYVALDEGALRKGYGLVRFSSEADVRALYEPLFDIETLDTLVRTEKNRAYEVREWLAVCRALPVPR
ncbi:MAG: methyltransferase domain-containing protein [Acidobacteriia bacterium]|nr:methyltransferase domain-containing protein [Terriglobia bacterium]